VLDAAPPRGSAWRRWAVDGPVHALGRLREGDAHDRAASDDRRPAASSSRPRPSSSSAGGAAARRFGDRSIDAMRTLAVENLPPEEAVTRALAPARRAIGPGDRFPPERDPAPGG